ncbi:MAG: FG-GAP-like repeat-containing protein [Pyrinomonadaceae bacterium]
MKKYLFLTSILAPLVFGTFGADRFLITNPGNLDPSFGGDGIVITPVNEFHDSAFSVELQPDGKIVVGGSFSMGQTADYIVARYFTNGSLDPTFDGDGIAIISIGDYDGGRSMTLQPDGKILITGVILGPTASDWMLGLARLNADGTLDTTLDGDGKVTTLIGNFFSVNSLAVQTDGKIIAAGGIGDGVDYNTFFYRYAPDGSLDTTFDGDGKVFIEVSPHDDGSKQIAIQPDGKIVSGGYGIVERKPNVFDDDFEVVRLNTDGSLDTTLDGDGIVITPIGPNLDRVLGMALQVDGKIVLTGFTQDLSFNWDVATVRYNSNGSLDTTFDGDGKVITPIGAGDDIAGSVRVQNDNKIVVAGRSSNGTNNDFAAIRYNPDGSLDTSFSGDGMVVTPVGSGDDAASALAIQSDGKIVLAGTSVFSPSDYDFALVRYIGDAAAPRRSPFDFDGDTKSDVGIFRPGPGEWWINPSSASQAFAAQFGQSTDVIVPADYTGDGKADIAVWRPSNGFWYVLKSENFTFFAYPFGANGDIPAPADYDGDDLADSAVFRPSQRTWFILRSSDGATTIQQHGIEGDLPIAADYDGDGKADIGIFRPNGTNGAEWWISRSSEGPLVVQFGASTDKAVPGDYTGDGKADVAIWRPATGEWFILRSEDFGFYAFPFGAAGDIPAPGDYDGDGRFDAAVFRPSQAAWFIQGSTAGTQIVGFGAAGDQPVASAFVR